MIPREAFSLLPSWFSHDKIRAYTRPYLYVLRLIRRSHSFVRYPHVAMELFSFFTSPFGLLLTTLITIGILKWITLMYRTYFYWRGKGIPFIPNSLRSIIMGWKMFLRRLSFADYTSFMYNYFPDAKYFGSMDFNTPAVFLRDPELIKDVLVKDFEHFHDHRGFVDESLDPLFSKNVFALRGDRWREMRNTLSPSFTASKMKLMYELVSKCSREFVNYLVDHPELYDNAIETKQIFRRYTTDVIATTAFGISVNSMEDQNNEFYVRGIEISKAFRGSLAMFKFIFMLAFPRVAKLVGMSGFASSSMAEFFRRVVGETIKIREEQGIIRPDMIHLLMQARNKEGPNVHKMTLDDIVSQAFIFFLAGFETSSTLMCFIAHELAINQDIQDRLREEVQHLAEGNEISYESLSKMTYMDMVISEALRKYPPSIATDRLCTKRYELPPSQPGGKSVIVEPDNITTIFIYGLHRDPKYFPNPDKFDPERFSEENKDNIVPYTYLPFGHGPRKCIGNRFALMETKILIAHLLQKFTLKRTEKTVEPVVYDKREFNLAPEGGFWIALEKRET